jgi:hypothetical protein
MEQETVVHKLSDWLLRQPGPSKPYVEAVTGPTEGFNIEGTFAGKPIYVLCSGGPLNEREGTEEWATLDGIMAKALSMMEAYREDIWLAVPNSPAFEAAARSAAANLELAKPWQAIALVGPGGQVRFIQRPKTA